MDLIQRIDSYLGWKSYYDKYDLTQVTNERSVECFTSLFVAGLGYASKTYSLSWSSERNFGRWMIGLEYANRAKLIACYEGITIIGWHRCCTLELMMREDEARKKMNGGNSCRKFCDIRDWGWRKEKLAPRDVLSKQAWQRHRKSYDCWNFLGLAKKKETRYRRLKWSEG